MTGDKGDRHELPESFTLHIEPKIPAAIGPQGRSEKLGFAHEDFNSEGRSAGYLQRHFDLLR